MIEKDFVFYQEALALKKLGFDERCFGNFTDTEKHTLFINDNRPTYSQAFRFFRQKFYWQSFIEATFKCDDKLGYNYWVWNSETGEEFHMKYETFEEAQYYCILKLIELNMPIEEIRDLKINQITNEYDCRIINEILDKFIQGERESKIKII